MDDLTTTVPAPAPTPVRSVAKEAPLPEGWSAVPMPDGTTWYRGPSGVLENLPPGVCVNRRPEHPANDILARAWAAMQAPAEAAQEVA